MPDVVKTFTGWELIDIHMSVHIGLLPGRSKPVLYMLDKNNKATALAVFSDKGSVEVARMLLNQLGEGRHVK
tara:strand:+ start:243 stop:458 length:216 start_codon:yes stop_codon:yes gene_type:complete